MERGSKNERANRVEMVQTSCLTHGTNVLKLTHALVHKPVPDSSISDHEEPASLDAFAIGSRFCALVWTSGPDCLVYERTRCDERQ
jgi:hypothetical protein